MPCGQLRSPGHGPQSIRHRRPSLRQAREDDRHKRRPSTLAVRAACANRTSSRERGFSPTFNRFSVLAGLDTTSTTLSSNLSQQKSSTRVRHRKDGRTKQAQTETVQQPRKANGRSVGELCSRMAEMCLEDEPDPSLLDTDTRIFPGEFTFSLDGVRHAWFPQFDSAQKHVQNSSGVSDQSKSRFPNPQEPCLARSSTFPPAVEFTELKRKESRFFPMSAFLAAPDTTAQARRLSSRTAIKISQRGTPSFTASAGAAEIAAVSAAYHAISSPKTTPPPLNISLGAHSRPISPSGRVQTRRHLLLPDMPINSKKKSSFSNWSSAPLEFKSSSTSLLRTTPTDPKVISNTPKASQDLVESSMPSHTSPSMLTPSDSLLQQKWKNYSQEGLHSHASSHVLASKRSSQSKVQADLERFLSMGHANPCWCDRHKPSAEVTHPLEPRTASLSTMAPASMQTGYPISRTLSVSDLDLESVILTLSPLGSDFEDVAPWNEFMYGEDWTLLTASDAAAPSPVFVDSTTPSTTAKLSWPTPTYTPLESPILIPRTQTPSSGGSSPLLITPLTPNSDGFSSPTLNHWTSQTQDRQQTGACTSNEVYMTEPTVETALQVTTSPSASATSIEWPTLEEAKGVRKTKRERRSTSTGLAQIHELEKASEEDDDGGIELVMQDFES